MYRLLMLDVDGVLNTSSDREPEYMNPKHLSILNDLQDELGFETVLSSTWRLFFDFKTFNEMFLAFGAKYPVIDYTPKAALGLWGAGHPCRGDEIDTYLKSRNLVPGENCSICILDDMGPDQFGPLKKYHVQTSMKDGLKEGHKKVVRMMFAKQERNKNESGN